jgi:hypothetical protein
VRKSLLVLIFQSLFIGSLKSQTLPVGIPILEDYFRRSQLLGRVDSNISFSIRPLTLQSLKRLDTIIGIGRENQDQGLSYFQNIEEKNKGFQILPIWTQTQYNLKRPYGWNDGAMIPARGFQSLVTGGVFAKYGLLRLQLRPEFVYAQNQKFDDVSYSRIIQGSIDLRKYSPGSYSKLSTGQSSLCIASDLFSFGLSSESLWWGPGINNSLLMSNTAPGFNHLTLNTNKPFKSSIGTFEAQIVSGLLKSTGDTTKPKDKRYLSGASVTYQPKWTPGLFLGLIRSFQMYRKDIRGISDYIPIFQAFEKKNTQEDSVSRDQLVSIFARWIWVDAHAEIYVEFGRGDHSANSRDFILEPDHSRSYLFGFQKMIQLDQKDEYLQMNAEVTQLQQSSNASIRNAGDWYTHFQILQGYTNQGELLGAGIGPGSNLHTFSLKWIKGLQLVGLQVEKYAYQIDEQNQYVNLITSLAFTKKLNKILISGAIKNIQPAKVSNQSKSFTSERDGRSNLQVNIAALYAF